MSEVSSLNPDVSVFFEEGPHSRTSGKTNGDEKSDDSVANIHE
jgi:hypothetical protein